MRLSLKSRMLRGWQPIALALGLAAFASACRIAQEPAPGGPLQVVAAENFWGSIVSQIGGDRVTVHSIISRPDADPHDYEVTPRDARAVAAASYVVVNGFNYDPWAQRLLDASPAADRVVLKVQDALRLRDDDNPHRWYSPGDVGAVIDRVVSDLSQIDPAGRPYFEGRRTEFETVALRRYYELSNQIRQRYANTPVGATESIVGPLVESLGLRMMTPQPFLQAISEGAEPSARDKSTFDRQIRDGEIAVLIFNRQNASPDVQRLVDAATARGIPVVSVTETQDPPTETFQDWQTKQLEDLAAALDKATGR